MWFQVMKDWSDLETKYQTMRDEDVEAAESFKKQMTERFQKTVQALEEESQAEKRQLQAMHQQRVISQVHIILYTQNVTDQNSSQRFKQQCQSFVH